MRLLEFYSLKDAKNTKDKIDIKISEILDKDLIFLDKNERTLNRWFTLLGDGPEFSESANRLILLEDIRVNAELYISILSS